jgi:hypothetical protein
MTFLLSSGWHAQCPARVTYTERSKRRARPRRRHGRARDGGSATTCAAPARRGRARSTRATPWSRHTATRHQRSWSRAGVGRRHCQDLGAGRSAEGTLRREEWFPVHRRSPGACTVHNDGAYRCACGERQAEVRAMVGGVTSRRKGSSNMLTLQEVRHCRASLVIGARLSTSWLLMATCSTTMGHSSSMMQSALQRSSDTCGGSLCFFSATVDAG